MGAIYENPMEETKPLELLLVDDETGLLKSLSMFFSSKGYSVRTATNVEGAIKRIEEKQPDFVITAYEMPGQNGLALIGYLVKYTPNDARPPILMLSATHRQKDIADYCNKEFGNYEPTERE
jgi:DNA-binding response OmpR family regulator